MAKTPSGLSRRTLIGASAVAAVAAGTAYSMSGSARIARRSINDDKTFCRGNSAEPDSLDPHKIQTTWENNIVGDMFMGLLTEDVNADPVPGAAESYTQSADGLTYTFKIRDHSWSDGKPVTAHDFVFSLRRILDPKTAAPYASLLYPIKNAEAINGGSMPVSALGACALDDRTLQLQFDYQVPYLPQLLTHYTMMPVPKHVVTQYGDDWLRPENIAVNGAYRLKEWIPNDHITLTRNPNFYGVKSVAVETVKFFPTQDYSEAIKRFRAGELDATSGVPASEIAWLRNNMPGVLRVAPWIAVEYVQFNFTAKPFDDLRVRQAISLGIDREILAAKVMRAGEKPAYTFVPPHMPGYPGQAHLAFQNTDMPARIAKAKALLTQAGYGPDNPLKFEFAFQSQTDRKLIAVALQSMWKVIGAQVRLVAADAQVHYNQLRRQHFQAAWAGWVADYRDARDFLFLAQTSAKDMNSGRYSNPKFDALMAQSDTTRDPMKRAQQLQQAEQTMLDDVAFAPVIYDVSRSIVSKQVKNWTDNNVTINRTRYIALDRRIADV